MTLLANFAARCWLGTALAILGGGLFAQSIAVRLDSGHLRISAPQMHFLSGKPLERLHNGSSVVYAVQATLLGDQKTSVLHRSAGRFAVSYDLWEEKFAVVRLGKPGQSATHLSAAASESWCLNNLAVPAPSLAPDLPFWLRLEVRAEDPREAAAGDDEPAFNLARLVELFSRPPRRDQPRWQEETGPLRLRDLQ